MFRHRSSFLQWELCKFGLCVQFYFHPMISVGQSVHGRWYHRQWRSLLRRCCPSDRSGHCDRFAMSALAFSRGETARFDVFSNSSVFTMWRNLNCRL